jgi:hypothetical protein
MKPFKISPGLLPCFGFSFRDCLPMLLSLFGLVFATAWTFREGVEIHPVHVSRPTESRDVIENTFSLTVSRIGSGSGTVSSSPAGISCGEDCTHLFNPDVVVQLTATPDPGSRFMGWSGPCTGFGYCYIYMGEARTVTAHFLANDTNTLTIFRIGDGSGTVSSRPTGINCGSDCSETYPLDTIVILTPVPASGSFFSGWFGTTCTGTGYCAFFMDGARDIFVSFSKEAGVNLFLPMIQRE